MKHFTGLEAVSSWTARRELDVKGRDDAVKARALSGQGMDAAVRAVAAQTHRTPAGESTTVSVRSVYRWLAEHDRDEPAVLLEPVSPEPVISRALPTALLDFLAAEKAEDRYASVPELIRCAVQLGVIGPHTPAIRSLRSGGPTA